MAAYGRGRLALARIRSFNSLLLLLFLGVVAIALWVDSSLKAEPPRHNTALEALGLDSTTPFRKKRPEFHGTNVILDRLGYFIRTDSDQTLIALPKQRVKSTRLLDLNDAQWSRWSEPDGGAEMSARLFFGLDGGTKGSGYLRLASLEARQFEVTGASVLGDPLLPSKRQEYSTLLVLALGVGVLVGCALFGQCLLTTLGIKNLSTMGSGLLLGYGMFGLSLVSSLKYLGDPIPGAIAFFAALVAMTARRIYPVHRSEKSFAAQAHAGKGLKRPEFNALDGLMAVIIFSWVATIALTYFKLQLLAKDPQFHLPDIWDLPKHLFATLSLYSASDWPPPNPFWRGGAFAYNFLFYYPPAFIARLVGNPLATFETLPIAIVAVAIALPMVILDIVRSLTNSKAAQLACVSLATWVGGLTPFWIARKPVTGAALFHEHLIQARIWVEELFVYAIYVPQHVFAVLCGLLGIIVLLGNVGQASGDIKRMVAAGILLVAGSLSSLILLPHLVASYAIGVACLLFSRWRDRGRTSADVARAASMGVAILAPLLFVLPFVAEASRWSGESVPLAALPDLSSQWFYVFAAEGLVVPFAVVCLVWMFNVVDSTSRTLLLGIAAAALVGFFGLLFGGYPDAGLKSGLWLRIALIPLAGLGLLFLFARIRGPKLWISSGFVAALFAGIAVLNLPTAIYLSRSGERPLDPEIKALVSYVRRLPDHSRIALLAPDQELAALAGRQMDFDFSPFRPDSYLPPPARLQARLFWEGLKLNRPEALVELASRYDYVIAPVGSAAYGRLDALLPAGRIIGGYAVFTTR